jgi:peptidoglycan/LPS O-acetylase OafA/YrhL
MIGVFRLFLALIVASDHAGIFIFGGDKLPFEYNGTAPVLAFFVISGFYMGLVLETKYFKGAPTMQGAVAFYINRALRIYPTYWLILLVMFALMPLDGQTSIRLWTMPLHAALGALHGFSAAALGLLASTNALIFGSDFLITHSLLPSGALVPAGTENAIPAQNLMIFPPAWTLAAELTFYLLAPLLMLRRPLLVVLCCALAVAHWKFVPGPGDYPNLLYCFAGVVSFFIYKWISELSAIRLGGIAATIAVMLFAAAANYLPGDNTLKVQIFVGLTWLMTPFAFASSHAVKLDRWLGNASYGIYVSHFAFYKFLLLFLQETTLKIVYLPTLIIAGLLIARFIEQPIDRVRDAIGRRGIKRRVDAIPAEDRF